MATIPNDIMHKMILEQRVKIEYIVGLYNKKAALKVDPLMFDSIDIESTIPLHDKMATPQHVATITSLRGTSSNSIEFELSDKQFNTMERMVMAATKHSGNSVENDPRFTIKCDPKLMEIPAIMINRDLQEVVNYRTPSSEMKMLALQCSCPKRYFCPSVGEIYSKGTDLSFWAQKAPTPKRDKSVTFCVAIPICGYILFGVPVEASVRTTWDDKEVRKLMTYGVSPDETHFYDDPRWPPSKKTEFTMLHDQILIVESFIDSSRLKKLPDTCNSGKHTYGVNKNFIDFMANESSADRIASACFHLYGMCPICYKNANPVFSLLDQDLF